MQPQELRQPVRHAKAQRKESGKIMSFDQEKNGEGRNTLPVKENSTLNEPSTSLGNFAAQSFDDLQAAQQTATCGQYQYGGTMPIVAPAARVSPVAGEAQP
jgi:hypothetical protein